MRTEVHTDSDGVFSTFIDAQPGQSVLRATYLVSNPPAAVEVAFEVALHNAIRLERVAEAGRAGADRAADAILESKFLIVAGRADAHEPIIAELAGMHHESQCGPDGRFEFVEIPTAFGEQVLHLRYAHAPDDETSASQRLHYTGIDFRTFRDTYLMRDLVPGGDIVRCANCLKFWFRESWTDVAACPFCKHRQRYERGSAEFMRPRREFRRN